MYKSNFNIMLKYDLNNKSNNTQKNVNQTLLIHYNVI